MRPQPALRAAFRGALTASRGQACVGRPAAAAPFPQNTAAYSSCSAPLRRLRPAMTTTTTQSFSTSSPRPSSADSTSTTTPSSSSSSSTETPAPILPASVLSQILFAPSSTPSSDSSISSSSTVASVTSKHPSVYATVQIHGKPYLVTPGDSLRLPFKMPGVQPGDELLLNRVGVVGNRMVTAVSSVSEAEDDTFQVSHVPGASVRAVVLGVETEPLRVLVKKKRRTRRKRTVKSKHQFTVLRIQEVAVEEQ